jgi:hypothetical protein
MSTNNFRVTAQHSDLSSLNAYLWGTFKTQFKVKRHFTYTFLCLLNHSQSPGTFKSVRVCDETSPRVQ